VLEICNELNVQVEEKLFTTDELKSADAAFFCGTAAEIVGWESFDDVPFSKHWNESIGRTIQLAYKNRVTEKELLELKEEKEILNAKSSDLSKMRVTS